MATIDFVFAPAIDLQSGGAYNKQFASCQSAASTAPCAEELGLKVSMFFPSHRFATMALTIDVRGWQISLVLGSFAISVCDRNTMILPP